MAKARQPTSASQLSSAQPDASRPPFVTVTHGVPLTGAFDEAARAALSRFTPGRPIRLLGIRAEFADVPG